MNPVGALGISLHNAQWQLLPLLAPIVEARAVSHSSRRRCGVSGGGIREYHATREWESFHPGLIAQKGHLLLDGSVLTPTIGTISPK
jgi:hypothetical protein